MADPERKAKRLAKHREQDALPRLKALELLGGKCVHCGETDPIVLQIDHVNSDGPAHRGSFSGTRAVYNDIIANWATGNWQALCARCNSIKRYTHHEWSTKGAPTVVPTDPKALRRYTLRRARCDAPEHRGRVLAKRRERRQALLDAYGGCCARCGFSDARALQIDHVDGGGCQHFKRVPSTTAMQKEMIAAVGTGRFQCLCSTCNWRKRCERNETTLGRSPGPRKRKSRAKVAQPT